MKLHVHVSKKYRAIGVKYVYFFQILQKFHVEITDDCREVRPAYTTFAVPDRPIKFIFNRR